MKFLNICSISFFKLIIISISFFIFSLYFLFYDLCYFLEWEIFF